MEENIKAKNWWESRMIWFGVIQTIIGILLSLADFLQRGSFSPAETALFVSGIFTVILRIWFTDSAIAK